MKDCMRKTPVTVDEARQIAGRYNDSHFGHKGEHARYTIPVDPERDDDCGLERFIAQYEEMAHALLSIAKADCNCDRGYPGSCGCGGRGREIAEGALESAGLCLECSGTGVHTIRVRGGDIDERNCHCAAGQARFVYQETSKP